MGGGGGFIDYDGDGWPDILLLNGDYFPGSTHAGPAPTLALYHNNRDGTFTDVTRQAGLDVHCNATGAAVGDYDNDGYDDLFIAALGHSMLFHNVPDGHGGRKFVDVTAQSGINDIGWPTSAAWVDYDGDGRLDLFVCHYLQWSPATDRYCGAKFKEYCGPPVYPAEPSRLYHNDGGGRFSDTTRKAGVYNQFSKALGVCICDLDHDGWPEIVVTNDTQPNCVYHNNRHGGFDEIGVSAGVALSSQGTARAGMGVDVADYENTGSSGLAIGNFSLEGLSLYDIPPTEPILAADHSRRAGLFDSSYPDLSFGLFFADFDNDGWPDLIVTNGHIESDIARVIPTEQFAEPGLLFQNMRNGTFSNVSAQIGACLTAPMVGRAACRGDYDNDGRIDILLIPNTGPPRLLHNQYAGHNHWITFKLIGTHCNRDAYGARVVIHAGNLTQSAYVSGGFGYQSISDARVHFGLGSAAGVDAITVQWPNGKTEAWPAQRADSILTLTQGGSPRTGSPAVTH
jgi:hypothetical protein